MMILLLLLLDVELIEDVMPLRQSDALFYPCSVDRKRVLEFA